MKCVRCHSDKGDEFYKNDSTCKECRKALVRANRLDKIDYYREYDRRRFKADPRVKERHHRYAQTEAGKAAGNRAKKAYCERSPVKRAAHCILGNAVRDGRISKPNACGQCGQIKRLHGHHDDYAKPLEVRWLCSPCHKQWHAKHGEGLNAV